MSDGRQFFPLCSFVSFVVQGVDFSDHQITRDPRIPRSFPSAAALLKLVNHAIQIGVAGAKASGEPVAAALHHFFAIGQHVKLARLARRNHGINAQPLLNHGRETRSLDLIALSRGAGTYLNFHAVLQIVGSGGSDQRCQCKSVVGFCLS
jgi:hypothetical protein